MNGTIHGWTQLHDAARSGNLEIVDDLLKQGADPNAREQGDNTYPLHWAAAAGHLDVVRRLADAGADVIGSGDDHQLDVIGWATCWDGCNDDAHRAIVDVLISHGAKHHIYSAIAMNLPGEVRRIVAATPAVLNRRLSRNENHQMPLHFAVRMNKADMVALLIELGADPLSVDGDGQPAPIYATNPTVDRPVIEAIHAMTLDELSSAARGYRHANVRLLDLVAALGLGDFQTAESIWKEESVRAPGALHVMSKRGDLRAVQWLLDHGADPNARWAHWDAEVTPLHLAVLGNHADVVNVLISRGADTGARDSKHDSDAIGWADFFNRKEILEVLGVS